MALIKRIGILTKKAPTFHRILVWCLNFIFIEMVGWFYRKNVTPSGDFIEFQGFLNLQEDREYTFQLPSVSSIDEVCNYLQELGINHEQGGWTIYIAPCKKVRELIPDIPILKPNAGLKILKHIGAVNETSYTPNLEGKAPGGAKSRNRTPENKELLRIANYLSMEGIGPEIFDLVTLDCKGTKLTCFIVEHVEKKCEDHISYTTFMNSLDKILQKNIIQIAHGNYKQSSDFTAPSCNGNLYLRENGKPVFVDFQSFHFREEERAFIDWAKMSSEAVQFGPKRRSSSENFLYQGLPFLGSGKRDTIQRWGIYKEAMTSVGWSLKDKVVLDIGCNSGLMSYFSLANGANYAIGWDKPDVAKRATDLMKLFGVTRWSAFGCELGSHNYFKEDISTIIKQFDKPATLFYLAIHGHVGFLESLLKVDWDKCFVEGHANENESDIMKLIGASSWKNQVNIKESFTYRDGSNPVRQLLLLERC